MTGKEAYRYVYEELKRIKRYRGEYDPDHMTADYMEGIRDVMTRIAVMAGREEQYEMIVISSLEESRKK